MGGFPNLAPNSILMVLMDLDVWTSGHIALNIDNGAVKGKILQLQ